MSKLQLKLVNDEQTISARSLLKACMFEDFATCSSGAEDFCESCDYAACTKEAIDRCSIEDHDSCTGSGVTDYCRIDY